MKVVTRRRKHSGRSTKSIAISSHPWRGYKLETSRKRYILRSILRMLR
jgi:hypothetical protein